ncbi:16S rRNA (guanine(966)-N(2))-methyltransferase RsmD [Paenibacillus sp. S-38]|uniref:16S rRNA (guanine(966)-N(2))-methyltransferase RsmD n=1 Tax=Paenibacillus sp. S-38 TaxID=3416710 RepID=UPI003CF2E01F
MRVISGSAKGRPLKAVPGMGTRPTTDKVKEAVFSMIGPYFDGGRVLDLFAGTGGLSIEALSRGMEAAVLTDTDKKAVETIHQNLKAAGFTDRAEVYRNDALRALRALSRREAQFDLVFLDPPYRMKLIPDLLAELQEGGLLAEGAKVVIEHDAEDVFEGNTGALEWLRRAEYGDTAITIFMHTADGQAQEPEPDGNE